MKKLLVMITALVGSFGTANAEITTSAGSTLIMNSVGSKTYLGVGGKLAFGFSTDLGNGTTVSMSGITFEAAEDGDAAPTTDADAFQQTTFTSGGASLTIGADLEIDYADQGVGGVAGDAVSVPLGTAASAISLGKVEGTGLEFSTSVGGSAIKIGYLFNNAAADNFVDVSDSTLHNTMAFQATVPVGPLSATVAYTADNTASTTVNTTGVSTSLAAGAGTLSLGYTSVDSSTDATQMSAAYSTTLGTAALSVGYASTEQGNDPTTTDIEVALSQSIGAGASVFAELHNRSGVDSGETSSIVLGTSISF